jgi:hypothetical protein
MTVWWKIRIALATAEKQWTRRDQRGNDTQVRLKCIVIVNAIALTMRAPMLRLGTKRVRPTNWHRNGDPLVRRSGVPTDSAATRNTGDANASFVHLYTCFQIIDRTNYVPHLDSGRRVATRKPIPPVQIVYAMVDSRDFAEFQRINNEADVTVLCKPNGAVLIVPFRAKRVWGMAANVEDGWQRASRFRTLAVQYVRLPTV